MDSNLKKSLDSSRGLSFGLLVNCIFSESAKEICPLSELRSSLSIEEKHEYVMGLSDEEVKNILLQHEECYEKRLLEIKQS
ncbi:MAG: hypothetical protein GQ556_03345 [Desulfobacterales bacterium]|nr:hypothetical protein [Desulfobacterales bacterium]